MSKKHFIALAKALRAHAAPRSLVEAIADTCAGLNPALDRAKFIAAALEG